MFVGWRAQIRCLSITHNSKKSSLSPQREWVRHTCVLVYTHTCRYAHTHAHSHSVLLTLFLLFNYCCTRTHVLPYTHTHSHSHSRAPVDRAHARYTLWHEWKRGSLGTSSPCLHIPLHYVYTLTHSLAYINMCTRCILSSVCRAVGWLVSRPTGLRTILIYRTYERPHVCVILCVSVRVRCVALSVPLVSFSFFRSFFLPLSSIGALFPNFSDCMSHTYSHTHGERVFFMTNAETVFSFVATDVWHCCPLYCCWCNFARARPLSFFVIPPNSAIVPCLLRHTVNVCVLFALLCMH